MTGWDALLDRFAGARIVVVGESCLDGWYAGPSRRLSREAPVPVVAVDEARLCPGGAANAAAGAAALGAQVRLVSAVGDDEDGRCLLEVLRAARVDTDAVLVGRQQTMAKRRVLSDAQLLVRFDTGGVCALEPAQEGALITGFTSAVQGAAAVLVADYDNGLLSTAVRRAVAAATRQAGALLVVDAHRPERWAFARPDAVKPDAQEVAVLLGRPLGPDRLADVQSHAGQLRRLTGSAGLVVTLDRDGALVLPAGSAAVRLHAGPGPVHHTVGAGDSFSAALALALACGADLAQAGEVGSAAAGIVVGQPATSACGLPELRDRLTASGARLLPVEQLAGCTGTHRALGRRVVMTNGFFDGLHSGHLQHLQAAKQCGDVLLVALNSDESTRRLRGTVTHRAADRAAVLAGLACVDHVVVFDADTPADLLRLARPDVWVKGGDYTEPMLREAGLARELGVELRILEWVDPVPLRSRRT